MSKVRISARASSYGGQVFQLIQGEQHFHGPVAQYLLTMRLPAGDEDRVNELSAKARIGSLTEAETQELDSYLHIGFLLGVLQAKARQTLDREPDLRQQ